MKFFTGLRNALIIQALAAALILLGVHLAYGFDVSLEWDANSEIDLAGYKLYMTQDVNTWPADPAQTIGYETTTADITGLADGTWYFGLTAYDWADNESEMAGIAVIWPDGQGPNKPKVKRIHLTGTP